MFAANNTISLCHRVATLHVEWSTFFDTLWMYWYACMRVDVVTHEISERVMLQVVKSERQLKVADNLSIVNDLLALLKLQVLENNSP